MDLRPLGRPPILPPPTMLYRGPCEGGSLCSQPLTIQQRTDHFCHRGNRGGSLPDRQVRTADQRKAKWEYRVAIGKQDALGGPEDRQGFSQQDDKLSVEVIRAACVAHTSRMTHYTCARLGRVEEISWGLTWISSDRTNQGKD